MSNTKKLLDAQSISDLLADVYITKDIFKNDAGEAIEWNGLELRFTNGDVQFLKCVPELKATVYYAREYTINKSK